MTHEDQPTFRPTPDVEFEGKVRHDDPDTSWAAAAKQTRTKTEVLQDNLEGILRTSGAMTDDELFEKYLKLRDLAPRRYRDVTVQSVRSRRSELRALGRVEDSGVKRMSANGGPSTVWAATTPARRAELVLAGTGKKK